MQFHLNVPLVSWISILTPQIKCPSILNGQSHTCDVTNTWQQHYQRNICKERMPLL